MKRLIVLTSCLILAGSLCVSVSGAEESRDKPSGKRLFEKHCALCHPNGENVVNPQKTLLRKHRAANNLNTPEAMVKYMMKPGPGMLKLIHEDKEITGEQANDIAAYILETFTRDR